MWIQLNATETIKANVSQVVLRAIDDSDDDDDDDDDDEKEEEDDNASEGDGSVKMTKDDLQKNGVFIDRFIFRSNFPGMRLPWEYHDQLQETN